MCSQAGIPADIVEEARAIALQSEQEERRPQLPQQAAQPQTGGCAGWATADLRTLHELVHNAELLAHKWHTQGMEVVELSEHVSDLKQQAQGIAHLLQETPD